MGEWFTESFGEDYLVVYRHRNLESAAGEVRSMTGRLDLEPGSLVLDIGCGMGRHALALADLGFRVTGLDLSEVLLREARRHDAVGRVEWMRGDMRRMPFGDETFDAAVNWFTSFGYFEKEEDNVRVLKEIRRVLKPGGRFLIDFLNPANVAANLVPFSERMDEPTGLFIRERRSIEDGCVVKRIEVQPPEGATRRYVERVRLIGANDFENMADEAGLAIEHKHGGYDGSPYEPERSSRLILTGRRPA